MPQPWTPEQYWEYVGSYAGEFERDEMRRVLAERGLSVGSAQGANAEAIARELALSYGRDPDESTSILEMCDADNRPVPIWRVYEEQAEHLLKTVLAPRTPAACESEEIALLREARDLAIQNRNYWQEEAERRLALVESAAVQLRDVKTILADCSDERVKRSSTFLFLQEAVRWPPHPSTVREADHG